MFCAIHEEHDHFAVCCETIFLKTSSTAAAVVAVAATALDDCAAIVVAAEGLANVNGVLLVADVAMVDAANGVAADDNDEEDEFESTFGAAPPKANVPNGTAGFVPVVGLPNENFGATVAVAAAEVVLALSFFKLPNVIGLAVDLVLSSGLAEPNVNCGVAVAFDCTAAAVVAATGFEPNTNVPLGAPKSMPPLPNVNFGVDVDAVAVAASLSLVC